MRLTSEYPDAEVGLNHPRCYHWDEAEHEGEDWGQQEAPPLPLHQALLVVDEGDALRCDHNVTREIMQWHVTYIGGRGLNITSHLHCKLLVSLVHVKSESNKICFGVIFTSCKCHAFFRNQSIPAQLNTALAPWEYHTALNITLKMIKWCVTGIMIILKTIDLYETWITMQSSWLSPAEDTRAQAQAASHNAQVWHWPSVTADWERRRAEARKLCVDQLLAFNCR